MHKTTNEQNRTSDMEKRNKLTVTRGAGGGGEWGKKAKGHQGTCIRDPWTKPTGWGLTGGAGLGESNRGKIGTTVIEQLKKKN